MTIGQIISFIFMFSGIFLTVWWVKSKKIKNSSRRVADILEENYREGNWHTLIEFLDNDGQAVQKEVVSRTSLNRNHKRIFKRMKGLDSTYIYWDGFDVTVPKGKVILLFASWGCFLAAIIALNF